VPGLGEEIPKTDTAPAGLSYGGLELSARQPAQSRNPLAQDYARTAMRVVHLCRHAKAAPGDPDELRELTPKGIDQARALGERLASSPDPPTIVLTSPLVRARQTAELVAEQTGADVRVEPLLGPGATVDALRRAVGRVEGTVATVGHQPDCSEIALAVTGNDPGFAPGASARLELTPA
jgi:phosphohistidine phosphatase